MPNHQFAEQKLQNYNAWQERIKDWEGSKMTPTLYCRKHQLSIDQFKYWQYQFAPETKKPHKVKKPLFNQVQITKNTVVDKPLEKTNTNFQLIIREVQLQIPVQFDAPALRRLLDCLGAK